MQTQYSTYRTLLAPVAGYGLSEAEVQDMLRQILPHLIALHDRKQAHGAISLDTIAYDYHRMEIILLDGNGTNHPIYLAPEILQTQQATPTADIYAISVVIIVLLTGFPPEALRTPNNTWNWQELCTVSDPFMQILNTALLAEPAFRFNNAGQMLQSLQPIINPSDSTITSLGDHLGTLILPSPLLTNLSSKPSSPPTLLPTEPHSLGALNSGGNSNHKVKKLKVNFSNSQIYRKVKAAKHQSKSNIRDLARVLLTMLLGGGITVSGAIGAYFYMQPKFANNGGKNVEFANSVNQSMNQAIASIDEKKRTDDDIDKSITLAKDKHQTKGDSIESKMMLQAILFDNRMRSKSEQILTPSEQDFKKNNDLAQKADKPTNDVKWQAAIDTFKGIAPTSYWQSRGKEIIEEAKQKLTTPAVPSSQPVAVPVTNVDPPRYPTTDTYTLPQDTYTPSDTYTLPQDIYNPTYRPPTENTTSPLPPAPRVAR
ncbi:MAG: hypothetical protein DCF19_04885 [Pseudanabaena frigida]|uniref:Protein kinase domain-containing protein n=1 Tax=Pseudanabaena frigida TaxID=945775 RepID=A0A2W4WN36_9CYAN|nr:MAG: hypothetical protein DCF19_04885 [Pseudanabaena frigida]